MQGPTVNDIAERLGISSSTVSRVMNGSPLVKDETRRTILAAARDMGYQKRTIRRHGPRSILTVALFLPRQPDVSHRLFYDPADLVAGLTAGFADVRTQIVVHVNQPRPELFEAKKSGNIDACVFGFTSPMPDTVRVLREREMPAVRLNREAPDADFVSTDHLAGLRALIQRVARWRTSPRVGYLSFTPAQPVTALREEAFLEACRYEGVAADRGDIVSIERLDQIDAALLGAMRERYDTILCFNDLVAVYAYQVLLIEGVKMPDDLSLAGYDNSPVRRLAPRAIDTVELSPYDLGAAAGDWLRRRIIDRSDERLQLRLAGRVIAGDTLAPENV